MRRAFGHAQAGLRAQIAPAGRAGGLLQHDLGTERIAVLEREAVAARELPRPETARRRAARLGIVEQAKALVDGGHQLGIGRARRDARARRRASRRRPRRSGRAGHARAAGRARGAALPAARTGRRSSGRLRQRAAILPEKRAIRAGERDEGSTLVQAVPGLPQQRLRVIGAAQHQADVRPGRRAPPRQPGEPGSGDRRTAPDPRSSAGRLPMMRPPGSSPTSIHAPLAAPGGRHAPNCIDVFRIRRGTL